MLVFEDDRPVQSGSLGRGVEMAGYGSTAGIWIMALIVFALMLVGFGALWSSNQRAMERAAATQVNSDAPGNLVP